MLYACVGAQIGPAGVQRGPEATASSHNHRPYRIKPTPTEPPRQGATSISNGIPSGRMLIFVSRGAISESGPNFAPVWTRQVRIPGPDSNKYAGGQILERERSRGKILERRTLTHAFLPPPLCYCLPFSFIKANFPGRELPQRWHFGTL